MHMTDEFYMKLALNLAARGRGRVSPNPMVGAVLVKKGKIIGRGWHRCCGEAHAEVNAIANATQSVKDSTLYVTLEPCCHYGKTPPCTDLIISHKIRRVVIGSADPNPVVCCRGIERLESAGLEVTTGILEDKCRALNEVFFHFMKTGLPFVTIKYAQTIDGRIATTTGHSQWISSPASLKYAHRLRVEHDTILVGIGTVLKDNPTLTARHVRGRNPLRIIVDSGLSVTPAMNVMQNLAEAPTLIVTTADVSAPAAQKLVRAGAQVLNAPSAAAGNVSLKKLLPLLATRGITSVLIEGGSQIITSALKDNIVNRLITVIAPKIIGRGIEAVGELNIRSLEEAKLLSVKRVARTGPDILIDSRLLPAR
jgi:diaminohydroxyphosphoribosylaminopyrimidine deaminase/5-amino-6-(5-phosphoribosylamino)uracil reductase